MRGIVKVEMDYSKLNTPERRTKAALVESEMQVVLNSDVFKIVFLRLMSTHPYEQAERSKYANFTPMEIYDHFMSGYEVLTPELDGIMQIEVDDYYTFKRVIGMTYKNSPTIYTNTKYYDKRSTKLVGSNFSHERGHKVGFSHDKKRTEIRPSSLCYLINKAYEEAWDKLFAMPSISEKKRVCTRSWKTLWLIRTCKWEAA